MSRLGVSFEAISADVDESRRPDEAPLDLASRLARDKAQAVQSDHPGAFVIGSDQIIAVDDDVLSKPGTRRRAAEQLRRLAGREHLLATAVCVIAPDGRACESVTSFAMKMRDLDDDEISRYVAEDEPLDCAGAYRIEAGGIRLFEYLRGDDYTAIVGLPLTRVRSHLEALGFYGEQ
jgi:septum formation protein